jgi:hypothetical protein
LGAAKSSLGTELYVEDWREADGRLSDKGL